MPGASVFGVLVVGHLLLTHLALYAGSVTNGTLPAVLLALALWSAAGIAVLYGGLLGRLGGTANVVIAMAALLLLLHAFAFSNYRQRALRPRRLGLQGLTVGCVLAFFVMIS